MPPPRQEQADYSFWMEREWRSSSSLSQAASQSDTDSDSRARTREQPVTLAPPVNCSNTSTTTPGVRPQEAVARGRGSEFVSGNGLSDETVHQTSVQDYRPSTRGDRVG